MKKSKSYNEQFARIFEEMETTDVSSEKFSNLLRNLKMLEEAREIHQRRITDGIKTGVTAGGAVVSGFLTTGMVASKLKADKNDQISSFDRDVNSWATKNALK